jgi:hypothetical protein
MTQAFLCRPTYPGFATSHPGNFAELDPRWNRVVLVGDYDWVLSVIHQLHILGFAAVSDWVHPVPTQNPGESIAVLKRPRL